jgi:glutamine amidotransferase
MCRMMAMVRAVSRREALEGLRGLACHGNVLPGGSCGHGDGWGFAGYERGALAFFEKSERPAAEDDRFGLAVDQIVSADLDIVIGHLRKASKGDITVHNAHPFRHGIYTFCHNGGIRESEKLPIGDLEPEGQTDSERYFLNIMARLESGEASSLKEALAQTVQTIHAHHKYSSICCMISDGRSVFAYRDFRRSHAPDEILPDDWDAYPTYYTLYFSPGNLIVASEPLDGISGEWNLMENGQLIEMAPDGTVHCDMLQ